MRTPISRRSFLSLLSLAVLTLFCPKPAYGFAKGKHDDIIENILFGRSGWSGMGSEVLEGLECAVALCLDQMQGKGEGHLEKLNKVGVPDLPELKEIDLRPDYLFKYGNAGNHRVFTHMGWHFTYEDEDYLTSAVSEGVKKIVKDGYGDDWPKRWNLRRKLLINSVRHLLKFNFF